MASTLSLFGVRDAASHLYGRAVDQAKVRWRNARRVARLGDNEPYGGERTLTLTPMATTYRREFQYMKCSTLSHMRRAGPGVDDLLSLARYYAKSREPVPDEEWMRTMCLDEEGEAAPESMQRQLFLVAVLAWEPGLLEWLNCEDKGSLREWVVWREREEKG